MQREIITKISVRQNLPTSISSTVFGANLNAVAFNLDFIARHDGQLVKDILSLYNKAKGIK